MTDTMPTRESLDEAARLSGAADWFNVPLTGLASKAIIAHARTLDKLHKREPVDPDADAVKRILEAWSQYEIGTDTKDFASALDQYKQEKAR